MRAALLAAVWLLGFGVAAAAPAKGVQVRSLTVGRHADTYTVTLRARLRATPRRVYAALTNYKALPRLNPAIRSVKVSPAPASGPGAERVATVVHACVWFFCKTLHQMQLMTPGAGYRLTAETIPAHSDFRSGHAQWSVAACDGQTCLRFKARVQPDFWIPPLIGPWLLQRKLRDETLITLHGLLRLARKPGDGS